MAQFADWLRREGLANGLPGWVLVLFAAADCKRERRVQLEAFRRTW
jgi:hypothetical protein